MILSAEHGNAGSDIKSALLVVNNPNPKAYTPQVREVAALVLKMDAITKAAGRTK